MKYFLHILVMIVFSTLLIIGCATSGLNTSLLFTPSVNNKLFQKLKLSNNKILILVDSAEVSIPDSKINKLINIFNDNPEIKSNITLREFDGYCPSMFTDLLTYIDRDLPRKMRFQADILRSDLLGILLNDDFEYDNIYYINYGFVTINRCYDDIPEGVTVQGSLSDFIVTPFTLNGPNHCFRFSKEKPEQALNTIIDHSTNESFSYEKIDKANIQNELKSILKSYFESHSTITRDLKKLFESSDLVINYDDKVDNYLLNNFKKPRFTPYTSNDILEIKNSLIKHVRNTVNYKNFISWLDTNINKLNEESAKISSKLKIRGLSTSTNLKGKYKTELDSNIVNFREDLFSLIVEKRWTSLIPNSIFVDQENNESILIHIIFEIDVEKYLHNNDAYNKEKKTISAWPITWIFDLLKEHIIYWGYFNKYNLTLVKMGSSDAITITGWTDRTDKKNLAKEMILSATPGYEYYKDIVKEKIKIHYNSFISYNSESILIPVIISDSFEGSDAGWDKILLSDKTRTMTGELTTNAYLYQFFNIEF